MCELIKCESLFRKEQKSSRCAQYTTLFNTSVKKVTNYLQDHIRLKVANNTRVSK